MTGSESVSVALGQCGLEHYVGVFVSEGVATVKDLSFLSNDDMKELGLNIGERNRLKAYIRSNTEEKNVENGSPVIGEQYKHYEMMHDKHDEYSVPTIEEREKYYELFRAIDKDGNGDIDYEEFVDALKKMDLYQSETKSRSIFNDADKDGGGSLDMEEFVSLMHAAKNGKDGTNLQAMAQASQDVISKLTTSSGVSITIDEIIDAPITDDAMGKVTSLKEDYKFSWMPSVTECNDSNCTLIFNLLVLDTDLIKKMISIVCLGMLEDLEKSINDIGVGVSGFVANHVNVEGVEMDAFRTFVILCHRYGHTSAFDKDSIALHMSDVHSFRKTALVIASNDSVQEVREAAVSYVKAVVESQPTYVSYGAQQKSHSFARDVAVGAGKAVAADMAAEVALGMAASGCSIM